VIAKEVTRVIALNRQLLTHINPRRA
jgi:hypothetical protein